MGSRFSLIHVRDLVDAAVTALNDSRARGVYYVSDGQAYSWQEVGKHASEILGVRYRTIRVPIALAIMGAGVVGHFNALLLRSIGCIQV
jgi:nucleoside-diphosphate-sugar epimerase